MSVIDKFVNRDPALKKRFDEVGSQMADPRPGAGRKAAVPLAEPGREASPAPSDKASIVSQASEASMVGDLLLDYLGRFVGAGQDDLVVIVLWILHAPVFHRLVTTPRLLVTSILPESGKSTLVDWIKHLCPDAIAMSSVSSAALLARLAAEGKPLLVDEADRSLRKDNPLTADFIAISNSGYKDGGSRPTLQPTKDGNWEAVELSTWCPMVFAGNNPDLPDDTRSRCILIYLYPSDQVEDTDWELIETDPAYRSILELIPRWAAGVEGRLSNRPGLDPRVKGRAREKWLPLARVAQTLDDYRGEDGQPANWLETVRRLAVADVEQIEDDAALGLRNSSPHTAIATDIARLWALQWPTQPFVASAQMCSSLAASDPSAWGTGSKFGTPITPRRLAGMLKKVGVNATRNREQSHRGYYYSAFRNAWRTLKVWETLDRESISPPALDASDGKDTIDTSGEGVGYDAGELEF